jgi:hypothetical protein
MDTFWASFSPTHLVTLIRSYGVVEVEAEKVTITITLEDSSGTAFFSVAWKRGQFDNSIQREDDSINKKLQILQITTYIVVESFKLR